MTSQKSVLQVLLAGFICFFLTVSLVGCNGGGGGTTTGNPANPEDSSSSGAVAESVGGALSGTGSNGTLAYFSPKINSHKMHSFLHFLNPLEMAHAAGLCPTFRSVNNCAAGSENLWLTYDACSFANSAAEWVGVVELTPTANTPPSCGTFPNPGPNNSLYRQYVAASGSTTPYSVAVTTSYGTYAVIDDHTSNLQNFNGDTITPLLNSGYGSEVTYGANGGRKTLALAHREWSTGLFDFTVSGSLNVSETSGASTRTVTGSVTVYHNRLQIIGTSTLNNVVHNDSCCLPVSGSITTVFSAGSVSPTQLGALAIGKSETMTFDGCGQATLQGYDGTEKTVSLSKCY
jgi:hypothetical protein